MTIQEFESQKDVHKISSEEMLLQVFILRYNKKIRLRSWKNIIMQIYNNELFPHSSVWSKIG